MAKRKQKPEPRYKTMPETEVAKLKEGTRVLLAPFEDQPEQEGIILAGGVTNGVIGVAVDSTDMQDDGIREVPTDQIIRVLGK